MSGAREGTSVRRHRTDPSAVLYAIRSMAAPTTYVVGDAARSWISELPGPTAVRTTQRASGGVTIGPAPGSGSFIAMQPVPTRRTTASRNGRHAVMDIGQLSGGLP